MEAISSMLASMASASLIISSPRWRPVVLRPQTVSYAFWAASTARSTSLGEASETSPIFSPVEGLMTWFAVRKNALGHAVHGKSQVPTTPAMGVECGRLTSMVLPPSPATNSLLMKRPEKVFVCHAQLPVRCMNGCMNRLPPENEADLTEEPSPKLRFRVGADMVC